MKSMEYHLVICMLYRGLICAPPQNYINFNVAHTILSASFFKLYFYIGQI